MPRKRPRPRHLDVHVVLDTNALYTGSASYFLRKEVGELIEQQTGGADLTIRWLVPEIVRHERQFQMLQEGLQLLPAVEKLERVLGHNLNITRDILETRVKEAVDRQIQQHGIAVEALSATEVDWPRVMMDSVYRRPPFQSGEKEKGFRDAVILETFVQIVSNAPSTAATTRVVLVSGDQLLRDAADARLRSANNVHILDSIDALKGLLNTLGSTVDEQFISAIKPKAEQLFFKAKDESTLYYKAGVGDSLNRVLREAPIQLPPSAERYAVEKWTINPPNFVRKVGQRIFWSTRFQARVKATKAAPQPEWNPSTLISGVSLPQGRGVSTNILGSGSTSLASLLQPISSNVRFGSAWLPAAGSTVFSLAEEQTIGYGTAHIDVSWSLAVTTSAALTKPRVEAVTFVEAVWD